MNAEVIDCIYDSPKYDPKYDPPPSSDAVSGTGGKRVTLVFRDGTKVSGSTTKRNLPSPVATNDTNLQNRSVATEDDRIRGTKRKNEDKDKDANQGMSIIEYTWKKNERGVLICEKYASHLMTHLRNRLKGFEYREKTEWFVIWQRSTDRINEDMFRKKVYEMGAILK